MFKAIFETVVNIHAITKANVVVLGNISGMYARLSEVVTYLWEDRLRTETRFVILEGTIADREACIETLLQRQGDQECLMRSMAERLAMLEAFDEVAK